jgi:RsmE family RNA methyltransferase
MNCLLLNSEEFDPTSGIARVDGRRRRHAEEILKATPGDRLRVGLVGGQLGEGRVLRMDPDSLELEISLRESPPSKLPLTLVLALPRPPVFRRLLSCIATLGVERLLVVGTARTEKSFWQSHVLDEESIEERLLLGLEQARDSVLPVVEIHRYFEPLVEKVLPPILEKSRGFVAHPTASRPCPHAVEGPVTLIVGPEGGFVDYEIDRFASIGVEPVQIGERILRVEPAVPYLVGRLFA